MVPARRVARLLPGSEGNAAYCVGPVTRTFCACYYARRLGITHVSHEGDADDCCSCNDVTKVGHLFFRAGYGTPSSDPIRTGVEGAAARIAKHVSHYAKTVCPSGTPNGIKKCAADAAILFRKITG